MLLIYCEFCKTKTYRGSTQARLGVDESATYSDCECRRFACVDINSIVNSISEFSVGSSGVPSTFQSKSLNNFVTRRMRKEKEKHMISGFLESSTSTEYEIRFFGGMVSVLNMEGFDTREVTYLERGFTCSMEYKGEMKAFKARFRTHDKSYVLKRGIKSLNIAPGATFVKSLEHTFDKQAFQDLERKYPLTSYKVAVSEINFDYLDTIVRFRRYIPDSSSSIEIEWRSEKTPSPTDVQRVLDSFYADFFHPVSMSTFTMREFSQTLSNYKKSVYDQRSFTDVESIFMIKVDGESSLVFDGGYFWFVTRFDEEHTVTAYKAKRALTEFSTRPDVIHCECLPDSRLVFIDLVALNGEVFTIQRPYVEGVQLIPDSFTELAPIIRVEHPTLESAMEELKVSPLPADGVIGVCLKFGTTYRVKKPTVDLLAIKGKLATGSTAVHRFTKLPQCIGMLDGYVYECELKVSSPKVYDIEKFIYRPDKKYANSRNVFKSVVLNACGSEGYDLAVRRDVKDVSFMFRKDIYERAMNRKTHGKLIIDVGTGRCQSFSFFGDKRVSFLFCDPKLNGVETLNRGKVRNMVGLDSSSKMETLRKLITGSYKTATFRGKIEDLLDTPEIRRYIAEQHVPIVFSFSASHVFDFCVEMLEYGANMIGCCYVYDDADESGLVMEAHGVSMKVVNKSESQGEFTFGSENVYRERAITKADLSGFECVNALADIEMKTDVAPAVRSIVKHICRFSTELF